MLGANPDAPYPAGAENVGQIPLDSLLMEGDDHTWNMSDWNWDPYQMFAEPKTAPACQSCNAFKRRKGPGATCIPVNHTHPECPPGHSPPPPAHSHNSQADAIAVAIQLLRAGGVNVSKRLTPESLLAQQLSQHLNGNGSSANMFCGSSASNSGLSSHNGDGSSANIMALLGAMQSQSGIQRSLHHPGPSHHHHDHHNLTCNSPVDDTPASSSFHAAAGMLMSAASQDKPVSVFASSVLSHLVEPRTVAPPSTSQGAFALAASGTQLQANPTPSLFSLPSPLSGPQPHEARTPPATLSGNMEEESEPSPTPAPATLQHATGQHASEQHATEQHKPGQHATGQHATEQHATEQHATEQHATEQHATEQHASEQHATEQHASEQHASEQHAAGPSAVGQHAMGQQEGGTKTEDPLSDHSSMRERAVADETDMKAYCQVPGCAKDLSALKDYHQRYRICDVHIKLSQVHKDGRLQRFCQQCGRFHDLGAFDGTRKSCRDQLMKHNARRRRRNGPATPASLHLPTTTSNPPGTHHTGQLPSQFLPQHATNNVAVDMRHNFGLNEVGGGGCVGGVTHEHPRLVPSPPTGLMSALHPTPHLTAHQSLNSILGLGSGGPSGGVEGPDVSRLLQALMSSPEHLHAFRVLLGVQTHPALPPQQPYPAEHLDKIRHGTSLLRPPSMDPPSYQMASDIVSRSGAFSTSYNNNQTVVRLSVKLFNCTPADLPHDVKHVLLSWLDSVPKGVEGYIRPGCVHLTFHIPLDHQTVEAVRAEGLDTLLDCIADPDQSDFWRTTVQILQLFDEMVVVNSGRVVERLGVGPSLQAAMQLPVVTGVTPCCVRGGGGRERVRVGGERLGGEGCQLVVRSEGRTVLVQQLREETGDAAVEFSLDEDLTGPALAYVEVAQGAYMSRAVPVLALQQQEMVEEVSKLTSYNLPMESVEAVLSDLAQVLKVTAAGTSLRPASLTPEERLEAAQRLLCFACDHGWVHTAKALMDIVLESFAEFADAVISTHRAGPQDGLTLLHRAVRSCNVDMVSALLDWGLEGNYEWEVDCGGPNGLSPLHISTMVDDEGRISLLLLDHSSLTALTSSKTVDDVTPFHLGFQMGHYSVDQLLDVMCLHEEAAGEGREEAAGEGREEADGEGREEAAGEGREEAAREGREELAREGHEEVAGEGHEAAALVGRAAGLLKCKLDRGCCSSANPAVPSCQARGKAVEPCVVCASTLPPLLLSIFGQCKDCGCRRPCLLDDSHHKGSCASRSSWSSRHYRAIRQYINSQCRCKHTHGTQYSIKALCPTCHVDRTMEVACVRSM